MVDDRVGVYILVVPFLRYFESNWLMDQRKFVALDVMPSVVDKYPVYSLIYDHSALAYDRP